MVWERAMPSSWACVCRQWAWLPEQERSRLPASFEHLCSEDDERHAHQRTVVGSCCQAAVSWNEKNGACETGRHLPPFLSRDKKWPCVRPARRHRCLPDAIVSCPQSVGKCAAVCGACIKIPTRSYNRSRGIGQSEACAASIAPTGSIPSNGT